MFAFGYHVPFFFFKRVGVPPLEFPGLVSHPVSLVCVT